MRRSVRRGYSLIECLVLMGAVGVVLGTTAMLVHRLMTVDRADRRAVETSEAIERLGRSLRSDAHAAATVPKVEAAAVALSLDDGASVDYRVERGRIVRSLRRGDKTVHHDVFRLPERAAARFETRGETPASRRLAVVIDQTDSERYGRGALRNYAIEAGLGRDRRYVGEAK